MEGKITAEAECAVSDDKDLQDEPPQEEQSRAGYAVAEMLSECFILYESVSWATFFYFLHYTTLRGISKDGDREKRKKKKETWAYMLIFLVELFLTMTCKF